MVYFRMVRVGVGAVLVIGGSVVFPLMTVIGAGVIVAVVRKVLTLVRVEGSAVDVEVTLLMISGSSAAAEEWQRT